MPRRKFHLNQIELVHATGDQPYYLRGVWRNGKIAFSTETFCKRAYAVKVGQWFAFQHQVPFVALDHNGCIKEFLM